MPPKVAEFSTSPSQVSMPIFPLMGVGGDNKVAGGEGYLTAAKLLEPVEYVDDSQGFAGAFIYHN